MENQRSGKKSSALKRIIRWVVIIVIILLVMRFLGLCSNGGEAPTISDLLEDATGFDITNSVPTPDGAAEDGDDAETSPSVYATKPVRTPAPAATATPVPTKAPRTPAPAANDEPGVKENGEYTSPEEVALYIHLYNKLPGNFITKSRAEDLGWVNSKGNLDEVAPGKSIGGTRFGNYEGLLPEKDGRVYYECDVNYAGGFRGGERIVYSNDGLVFYTADHYESFTQLY